MNADPKKMTYLERLSVLQARYHKTLILAYKGKEKVRMRRFLPSGIHPDTEQARVYRSGRW